jgi:hypothetical protein
MHLQLSPLEQDTLIESLKNRFESITTPLFGLYDPFIHLYRLCIKLGLNDLAEEFNNDFYTVYNVDLKKISL